MFKTNFQNVLLFIFYESIIIIIIMFFGYAVLFSAIWGHEGFPGSR